MSDIVVDSSVVAKWVLPEPDSDHAMQLVQKAAAAGDKLIILDLVYPEVMNAIWKQHRRRQISRKRAKDCTTLLFHIPMHVETAAPLLEAAFEIAVKYDRAVYDALFVALAQKSGLHGVTADEPLYNSVHADFPGIVLLRDLPVA